MDGSAQTLWNVASKQSDGVRELRRAHESSVIPIRIPIRIPISKTKNDPQPTRQIEGGWGREGERDTNSILCSRRIAHLSSYLLPHGTTAHGTTAHGTRYTGTRHC
jgi:hypothetical protein